VIRSFFHFEPEIPATAYVDPGATVIGRVFLGEHASLWPGAVLRGDINSISVGDYSNVQDNSVLHVADAHPVLVGKEVVIGHSAVVHGCTIEDGCLIGIGAKVLNGVVVREGSILAAGALVPEGAQLEPRSLYMGAPAKKRRDLTEEEVARIRMMARKYAFLATAHRASLDAAARGQKMSSADWERGLQEFRSSLPGPGP